MECALFMLYDLRELYRKGKIVDSRLYDILEDIYSKLESGSGRNTDELESKIESLESRIQTLEESSG